MMRLTDRGDYVWRSQDGRFAVRLPKPLATKLRRWCRTAGGRETGGILLGYYTPALDRAIVTAVSPAPRDSQRGRTWFARGTQGLQVWLDRTWRTRRHYYLGEWHYHPEAVPTPSPTDCHQMQRIACDPSYHCPEPILLILGGEQLGAEHRIAVFVFSADDIAVSLSWKGNCYGKR